MFVLHARKTLRCSSLWCVVCTGPSALKWERIPDDKFNSIIAFLGTKLAARLFSGASCKHIVHDCLPFGHEFAVSNPIAVGYVCPRIPAEHVSETMQLRALPAVAEHAAQFCTLAMVVERQSLTDLLRNTLAGQHFLWTAGCSRASHALFFFSACARPIYRQHDSHLLRVCTLQHLLEALITRGCHVSLMPLVL